MGYQSVSVVILLTVATLLKTQTLYEGEGCSLSGRAGTCRNIRNCQAAIDNIRKGSPPQICSFSGNDPIVCCPGAVTPLTTTTRPKTPSTTPYVPPVYDYHYEDSSGSECPPISANLTSKKTGQKAWDKCIEYQQVIYPCERATSLSLANEMVRGNYCGHQVVDLVVGGVDTKEKEFPHMVLLGYGNSLANAQWLCGGTLISERYVLTAGHCTFSRDLGEVKFVRTGALRRSDPVDSARTYTVENVVKHPDYKPPVKYNDIALLRTNKDMKLDQFAVPACLYTGVPVRDQLAIATGWGATQYKGANADVLQKVTLEKFTVDECKPKFPIERNMKRGVDDNTQICYGHKTESKDTCQGDSGGPLQIMYKPVYCMYAVIGVTSFGKACGFAGNPGIYTRVAAFVPWIESVVWP